MGPVSKKSPRDPADEALSALNLIDETIEYDDIVGKVDGAEEVRVGLDAMASALETWLELDMDGAPLDQVLAELNEDGHVIEAAARLNALVARASYAGGLGKEGAREAEELRGTLYDELGDLIEKLREQEEGDPGD